jgi:fatty acid desaturase
MNMRKVNIGSATHADSAETRTESRPCPSGLDSALSVEHSFQGRKPRYVLGTFWVIVAILAFIAGATGLWWSWLVGIACIGYAIYLYRGGRWGFFFF